MDEDIPGLTKALDTAYRAGIVTIASASNEGANNFISYPARLRTVFCIGAADGKGFNAPFNPPCLGVEKYSALGVGVLGADIQAVYEEKEATTQPFHKTFTRRSGTSTAVPLAAGIAATFLDFIRHFTDTSRSTENTARVRKLFLKMSEPSAGQSYRYLAPWLLFSTKSAESSISSVLQSRAGE